MTNADRASERNGTEASSPSEQVLSDDHRLALVMRAIEPFTGRTERLFNLREWSALCNLVPDRLRAAPRTEELRARLHRPEAVLELLDLSLGAAIRRQARASRLPTSALDALLVRARERLAEGCQWFRHVDANRIAPDPTEEEIELGRAALIELEQLRAALQRIDTDGDGSRAAASAEVARVEAATTSVDQELQSLVSGVEPVVVTPDAVSTEASATDERAPESRSSSALTIDANESSADAKAPCTEEAHDPAIPPEGDAREGDSRRPSAAEVPPANAAVVASAGLQWVDRAVALITSNQDLTVEKIARLAGVDRSTLYRHERVRGLLKLRPRKSRIRSQRWDPHDMEKLPAEGDSE